MSTLRPLLMALVLAALVVGCGSSGGSPSAKPSDGASAAPSGAASAAASNDAGASSEPAPSQGGGGGGGDIPDIADGTWGAGTARAEISGDVTTTIDATMPASLGYTAEGLTVFVFTDAAGASVINITLSNDEPTGFSISSNSANVATAGTWGDDGCEIDVTKNDDSGIEATYSCNDIPAIAITAPTAYTIDVKGEFEVAR